MQLPWADDCGEVSDTELDLPRRAVIMRNITSSIELKGCIFGCIPFECNRSPLRAFSAVGGGGIGGLNHWGRRQGDHAGHHL